MSTKYNGICSNKTNKKGRCFTLKIETLHLNETVKISPFALSMASNLDCLLDELIYFLSFVRLMHFLLASFLLFAECESGSRFIHSKEREIQQK